MKTSLLHDQAEVNIQDTSVERQLHEQNRIQKNLESVCDAVSNYGISRIDLLYDNFNGSGELYGLAAHESNETVSSDADSVKDRLLRDSLVLLESTYSDKSHRPILKPVKYMMEDGLERFVLDVADHVHPSWTDSNRPHGLVQIDVSDLTMIVRHHTGRVPGELSETVYDGQVFTTTSKGRS